MSSCLTWYGVRFLFYMGPIYMVTLIARKSHNPNINRLLQSFEEAK